MSIADVKRVAWVLLLTACAAPVAAPVGPALDAGPGRDAGRGLDAGPRPDAGPLDAGTDAGMDAGAPDAGLRCRTVPQVACNPSALPAFVCDQPSVDEGLEALLMDATGSFVPPEPEIFRGVRDVAALQALEPGWSYGPIAQVWAPGVSMGVDAPTFAALDAGTWHGWDCALLSWPAQLEVNSHSHSVSIQPDGLVDSRALARAWATQPGVTYAQRNAFGSLASCGYGRGACVILDGGDWTWFVGADRYDCSRFGAVFETHEDGSIATLAHYDTDGGDALSPEFAARFAACVELQR